MKLLDIFRHQLLQTTALFRVAHSFAESRERYSHRIEVVGRGMAFIKVAYSSASISRKLSRGRK